MRASASRLAAALAAPALAGCVIHHHGTPPPPPPPPPPGVTVVTSHVHTEYCVMYTDLYGCSHDDIIWLESRGCDWDDMGILFYLWWGCGRRYTVYEVHRWHYVERVSWHHCFTRARVDPYGMFVRVDYTPAGPCGRAYGYYHRREPLDRFQFQDDDLRAVFRVNIAVNYYKQPPRQAFERVRDRETFHAVVREEHSRQNRPRWESTPQGRKEQENRDRGRGPGTAPAPGRGGEGQGLGRGPGAAPAQGHGRNPESAPQNSGGKPQDNPPSKQKPPRSGPPDGKSTGQKDPHEKPTEKSQPDPWPPDKDDARKGPGNPDKDRDKEQTPGPGGGRKK